MSERAQARGGVVDTWVTAMQDYANGAEVAAAEAVRAQMEDWVTANC